VALARLLGARGAVPFSGPVFLRFCGPLEDFIFYTLRSFQLWLNGKYAYYAALVYACGLYSILPEVFGALQAIMGVCAGYTGAASHLGGAVYTGRRVGKPYTGSAEQASSAAYYNKEALEETASSRPLFCGSNCYVAINTGTLKSSLG
jgi:hypothetical protein